MKFKGVEEIDLGWKLRDSLVDYGKLMNSVEKLEKWDQSRVEKDMLLAKTIELCG